MTPEQFTQALKGYIDITDGRKPSEAEWQKLVEKLQSVFKKETKIPSGPILRMPNFVLPETPDCQKFDLSILDMVRKSAEESEKYLSLGDGIVNQERTADQVLLTTQTC